MLISGYSDDLCAEINTIKMLTSAIVAKYKMLQSNIKIPFFTKCIKKFWFSVIDLRISKTWTKKYIIQLNQHVPNSIAVSLIVTACHVSQYSV